MPGMIRVADQAALASDLELYGALEEAPVEHQDEVEAYLRSKYEEINTFLRIMTSIPAA